MATKLNIAEILENCPKGMELYSPIFGKVYLYGVRPHLAVIVNIGDEHSEDQEEFLYDGRYGINGKCMLFPSEDKASWEGFVPPVVFTDGDIVATDDYVMIGIATGGNNNEFIVTYCVFDTEDDSLRVYSNYKEEWKFDRFATEEEKEKLFKALKDRNYVWNAEAKKIETLIEPEFKDGDVISNGCCIAIYNGEENDNYYGIHIGLGRPGIPYYFVSVPSNYHFTKENTHIATEEERQQLFLFLKRNNLQWNSKGMCLEKKVAFNEGDVIVGETGDIAIYKQVHRLYKEPCVDFHCRIYHGDKKIFHRTNSLPGSLQHCGEIRSARLATDEEKEKLFDAIKENGYVWDAENNELKKRSEPKFKVGDTICEIGDEDGYFVISDIDELHYYWDARLIGRRVLCDISDQNNWRLVPEEEMPEEFKDGDIVATKGGEWIGIVTGGHSNGWSDTYCVLSDRIGFRAYLGQKEKWAFNRQATDEEKDRLFKAIADNGYVWNAEVKCLEKPEPEFKDGDVVSTHTGNWIGIVEGGQDGEWCPTYCALTCRGTFDAYIEKKRARAFNRLATEEEKERLFKAIADHGYVWNAEEKRLERVFKDGDVVTTREGNWIFIFESSDGKTNNCHVAYDVRHDDICLRRSGWAFSRHATEGEKERLFKAIEDNGYVWNAETKKLDELEDVKKFDIDSLKPFDKVLVRDCYSEEWNVDFFGYRRNDGTCRCMTFTRNQCIPFEGNEYLLGTNDPCHDFYNTWNW